MSHFFKLVLAIALSFVFSSTIIQATGENDEDPLSLWIDSEEYENYGDDFWPAVLMKRASFWAPHPSDYNPMRRPGPLPRTSKKSDLPFHPVPRALVMRQRSPNGPTVPSDDDTYDSYLDRPRQKRFGQPTGFLFRFGHGVPSTGLTVRRNKPGQKYVPNDKIPST